jgi:hypothetical protein
MNDQPGLDVQQSTFSGKSFKIRLPCIDLFDSLTPREVILAIPSEKLVQLNVNHLMGLVRAAKREKYFEYLLTVVGRDIGPQHAKLLAAIIKKTNKVFGRAPVTKLLFLARVAVAYKFDCDTATVFTKKPRRTILDMKLITTLQKTIDQLHEAVNKTA